MIYLLFVALAVLAIFVGLTLCQKDQNSKDKAKEEQENLAQAQQNELTEESKVAKS